MTRESGAYEQSAKEDARTGSHVAPVIAAYLAAAGVLGFLVAWLNGEEIFGTVVIVAIGACVPLLVHLDHRRRVGKAVMLDLQREEHERRSDNL